MFIDLVGLYKHV